MGGLSSLRAIDPRFRVEMLHLFSLYLLDLIWLRIFRLKDASAARFSAPFFVSKLNVKFLGSHRIHRFCALAEDILLAK
ncbi:hypothetical protein Tco_0087936 [Tanacetum coccineum]